MWISIPVTHFTSSDTLPVNLTDTGACAVQEAMFGVVLVYLVVLLVHCPQATATSWNSNFLGREVSNKEYYEMLGLEKGAEPTEIKRSYRRKAMSMHPDKGGDAEQFKALSEAYEVLSDPKKKEVYDRFGKEGLSGSGGFGGQQEQYSEFSEIFRGFGGGVFGGRGFSVPIVYNVGLSLEDFYTGKEAEIRVGGSIFALKIQPGMIGGVEMRAQIEDPNGSLREVIFILEEREHSLFTRKNADLFVETTVSLVEALVGFERTLTHLDGSQFKIKAKAGELRGTDENILVFENLGMPVYKQKNAKGRLFLNIKLEMPTPSELQQRLTKDERAELYTLLRKLDGTAATKEKSDTTDKELSSCKGHSGDIRQFGRRGGTESSSSADNPFRQFFF